MALLSLLRAKLREVDDEFGTGSAIDDLIAGGVFAVALAFGAVAVVLAADALGWRP